MKTYEIRQSFVAYYRELGFSLLPRASLLHPSIPMSFVMSAGLAQVESSQAWAESENRVLLVQECFRHFDLDKVGTDAVHLSFFEMPGAFTFGQDGKPELIDHMWTLTTKILGVDASRIWASYFGGGKVLGEELAPDDIARQSWIAVGLPEDRLVGLGAGDNYWLQGDGIDDSGSPRKAGPHTELFYDRDPAGACGPDCKPGCKCGRFVEFSNTLFICRELDSSSNALCPMEYPFSETVIGTERVAMILQGSPSVFDTDLYKPLTGIIDSFLQRPHVPQRLVETSKWVMADYLRAMYCLVLDGAPPPGKDGRERIMRKLIRGVITRQILLDIHSHQFFSEMVTALAAMHRPVFAAPESEKRLQDYFWDESRRFHETIRCGYRQLEKFLRQNDGGTLSGEQVVFLEKQCGLPHLLVADALREKGLPFAEAAYRKELQAWKRAPHN